MKRVFSTTLTHSRPNFKGEKNIASKLYTKIDFVYSSMSGTDKKKLLVLTTRNPE